jgi:hypothetical protein
MEEDARERWHKLCVWAMNELDVRRLTDVLRELNALLTKDVKAIEEEDLKKNAHLARSKPA